MEGKIKWFSEKKGFGFLEAQGQSYFIHKSEVAKNLKLEKGQKVIFEPEDSPRGPRAIKVKKIIQKQRGQ